MTVEQAISEQRKWLMEFSEKYPNSVKFISHQQDILNTIIDALNDAEIRNQDSSILDRLNSLRWYVAHSYNANLGDNFIRYHVMQQLLYFGFTTLAEIEVRCPIDIIVECIEKNYMIYFDSMPFDINNYNYYLELLREVREDEEAYKLLKNHHHEESAPTVVKMYEKNRNILENLHKKRFQETMTPEEATAAASKDIEKRMSYNIQPIINYYD